MPIDPREPSAQLDGSGKLAAMVERSANRCRLFLGHCEHLLGVEILATKGKLIIGSEPHRCNRTVPCHADQSRPSQAGPCFATLHDRLRCQDELEAAIAAWTRGHDKQEAAERLRPVSPPLL